MLIVYVLVQQIESNVIIPLVMSRTTRLHPAVIAIGVRGGRAACSGSSGCSWPCRSSRRSVILTEEIWVREIEAAHENRATVGHRGRRRRDEPLPERAEPGAAAELDAASASGSRPAARRRAIAELRAVDAGASRCAAASAARRRS